MIESLNHVFEGARRAGRKKEDIVVASNLTFSVGKDSEEAKNFVREVVALYVADPTLTASELMLQHSKVKPEDLDRVKEGMKRGGIRNSAELVTDEMIEEFSIAGTPEDCIKKLRKLGDLGVQMPIAFDLIGPKPDEAIELISKEILPAITRD